MWAAGHVGGALQFDGATSYVEIDNPAALIVDIAQKERANALSNQRLDLPDRFRFRGQRTRWNDRVQGRRIWGMSLRRWDYLLGIRQRRTGLDMEQYQRRRSIEHMVTCGRHL